MHSLVFVFTSYLPQPPVCYLPVTCILYTALCLFFTNHLPVIHSLLFFLFTSDLPLVHSLLFVVYQLPVSSNTAFFLVCIRYLSLIHSLLFVIYQWPASYRQPSVCCLPTTCLSFTTPIVMYQPPCSSPPELFWSHRQLPYTSFSVLSTFSGQVWPLFHVLLDGTKTPGPL